MASSWLSEPPSPNQGRIHLEALASHILTWLWAERAAGEEMPLGPAQLEKEKEASPVLVVEYLHLCCPKPGLSVSAAAGEMGKPLRGELILSGALVSLK